jgi:hypothetical protein
MRPLFLLAIAGSLLVPNVPSNAVAQCCVSYAAPTSAFTFPTSTYSYYGPVLYDACPTIVETFPCYPAPSCCYSPCTAYCCPPTASTVAPPPDTTAPRVPGAIQGGMRQVTAQDKTWIELVNKTGNRMHFRIEFQDEDGIKRTSQYFWLPPGETDLRGMPARGIRLVNGRWKISVVGYDATNGARTVWGGGDGVDEEFIRRVDDPKVGVMKYVVSIVL